MVVKVATVKVMAVELVLDGGSEMTGVMGGDPSTSTRLPTLTCEA